MAVVCKNIKEVRDYFDEAGSDLSLIHISDWFSVTDTKRDELAMEAINEVIDEYAGFGIFDTCLLYTSRCV